MHLKANAFIYWFVQTIKGHEFYLFFQADSMCGISNAIIVFNTCMCMTANQHTCTMVKYILTIKSVITWTVS